jgi:hypothetical protein
MRKYPYITVGSILEDLKREGLSITRASFYRLEKRLHLPGGKKTSGKLPWRVYSKEEADSVKKRIKEEYNFLKYA